METLEFLSLVLPGRGRRCVAVPNAKGSFDQIFPETNEAAASAALKLDGRAGKNVFIGCASYVESGSRKGDNIAAVRSFWMDLDVQKPGEDKPGKYATKADAVRGVVAFVKDVGLPSPLLVSSGGGIHCWWPMSQDMAPDTWRRIAPVLKAAAKHQGLLADPTRSADIASVLRPVGVHHRKGDPKLVKVINHFAGPIDLDDFVGPLESYILDAGVEAPATTAPRARARNNDLSGGMDYAPSYAALAADKCGVMARVRDTAGDTDQPTWYGVLGVLGFQEDGDEVAHAWSDGHKDYAEAETDAKLAQARRFRPTTCAKLADGNEAICKACGYKGKINTPFVLGYPEPEPEPQPVTVTTNNPFQVVPDVTEIELPAGYSWMTTQAGPMALHIEVWKDDKDGKPKCQHVPFCATKIVPVNRMNDGDRYTTELEIDVRGQCKRFTVPTSIIAEGGRSLASALGEQEVVAYPGQKPQLDAYLQRWMDKLKLDMEEVRMQQAFGWNPEREFVLGDRIICADGERVATLQGVAHDLAPALKPKGSYETWRHVINTAYNYPGQEDYQYLVLLSFAAPLFSMFRQYGGITVYAHSEGSGVGKTTAQRAGLSAWGDWEELQLSDDKVTFNSLWAHIGAYHNLPVLYDELTNTKNDIASALVFSVSSGRQKKRLSSDGSIRKNNSNWSTIVMASGNNLLSEKLSLHRANAEAELSRLFEFTMRAKSKLTPNEAADLFPLLLDNYGHAGIKFARHLVDNYDAVEAKLLKAQQLFNTVAGVTQTERYWSALQACVIVALKICRQLDLVGFEEAPLLKWIVDRVGDNRKQRIEAVADPLEQLGTMMADLWDGILVTAGEGDMRTSPPQDAKVLKDPRGTLVGRAIMAREKHPLDRSVVLLNVAAVREWCNRRGVSAKEMHRAAFAEGWIEREPRRYALGRGTETYANITPYIPCWVIDPVRMGAGSNSIGQKLQSIVGGRAADQGGAE